MYIKGVILEVKDDYSIVLTDDYTMLRIKNKNDMNVGDTILFLEEDIYIKSKKDTTYIKVFAPIIAVAAIFLFLFINPLFKSKVTPYSLVSIDINPSIQLELDNNQNIITAIGLNNSGKNLNLNEIKGLSLMEGLPILKKKLENEGITLKKDTALVGFSFLSNNENPTYEEEVKKLLSSSFNETKILYLKVKSDHITLTKAKGISLGRYEAELNIEDEEIEHKIENMTVEEIFQLLNGKTGVYLNEDITEELKDELEDRLDINDENKDNEDAQSDSNDSEKDNDSEDENDEELDDDLDSETINEDDKVDYDID